MSNGWLLRTQATTYHTRSRHFGRCRWSFHRKRDASTDIHRSDKQTATWNSCCTLAQRTQHTHTVAFLRRQKGKGVYISSSEPTSELRSVTWHNMRLHSVTCHLTQVNAPRRNLSQTDRYSIYLPGRDGRLSWPDVYLDGLPDRKQSPIPVVATWCRPRRVLNPWPFGRKSDALLLSHPSTGFFGVIRG